jgi:hypothetical protein
MQQLERNFSSILWLCIFSNSSFLKPIMYQATQTHSSENICLHYQRLPYANTYRPYDEAPTPPQIVILILFKCLLLLFILTLLWFTPLKQKHNYLILMVFPLMIQILNITIQNCKKMRSQFPHKLCTYYFTIVHPDDGLLEQNILLK